MATEIKVTRSIGSSSRGQWDEIASMSSTKKDADFSISSRKGASESQSQRRRKWMQKSKASERSRPQQAAEELDLALEDEAPMIPVSSEEEDSDDNSSTYMESEVTYDHSEATARTGNVSSNSSRNRGRSRSESSERRGCRQRRKSHARRNESPVRRLVMCGVVDVTEELRGSIEDVNETVRHIVSTMKRFGSDEKDAVRETIKDASYYVREKVRAVMSRKSDSRSQQVKPMNASPPGQRGSEKVERQDDVQEIPRQECVQSVEKAREEKDEEVLYEKCELHDRVTIVSRMLV